MQKRGLKYYSLFATMLFVLPVLLQLVKIQFGFDMIIALFTYVIIIISFIYNYVDAKKRGDFAPAFNFDNSYRMDIFSYLTAFGFFVEFISNVATLVRNLIGQETLSLASAIPMLLCALFALLTSFYFLAIGVSYGTGNYDFRSFKMYHIVVMLWSIFKLMTLFGQAIRIVYDINGVLRYLAIMVMAFFFYYFVSEVESDEGASIKTVYTARMCAYTSGFYCTDRIIMLITGNVKLDSNNTVFALTSLFVCLFCLFFEKSIIHNTKHEE